MENKGKNRKLKTRTKANSRLVAVFTVMALVLIIWFVTMQFINGVGSRKKGVAVSENKKVEESGESKTTGKIKGNNQASKNEEKSEKNKDNKVIVEGDGDYHNADSWIGKTFEVKEASNIRSGPGTTNPVLASATKGSRILVTEAEEVDDAIWVKGSISIPGGEEIEGWLYVFVLSTSRVDS